MKNSNTVCLHNVPAVAGPLTGGDFLGIAGRFIESLFPLTRLAGLYEGIREAHEEKSFVDRALARLNVTYQVVRGTVDSIPKEGPLVIVANHPYGGAEGLVLMSLLDRVRSDVKVMATRMLGGIPEIRSRLFMVDPFGGTDSAARNMAPVRQCLRWVRGGGALVIFPAGEVAHFDWGARRVRESDWHDTAARLVRHTRATVLPVFFEGANGPLFQAAGAVHPRLRTALLTRELVNKSNHSLKVRLGRPLPFDKLAGMASDAELTQYLRLRVLLQGVAGARRLTPSRSVFRWARPAPVAAAESLDKLAADIRWLPPGAKLIESGDYDVFIAGPRQIPGILREITRLREVTFRSAGEGSGLALDRDVFDQIYQHLFVWNRKTSEVVGAYRLGLVDKILPQYGLNGLYTNTLFSYTWEQVDSLGCAIEIGRSFVRQEYQRKHLPLLLLWKGIGRFVAQNPKYRNLFGTVSMSNTYSETSRHLVAEFFEQQKSHDLVCHSVRPRAPFHGKGTPLKSEMRRSCRIPDLEALSEMVREVESDGKGIPVLMRQYMKLGGRVLACAIDPKFNMTLDALVVVDLPRADPRLLELYMGDLMTPYLRAHEVENKREELRILRPCA